MSRAFWDHMAASLLRRQPKVWPPVLFELEAHEVKRVRIAARLSTGQFARRLARSQRTVERWEAGVMVARVGGSTGIPAQVWQAMLERGRA
jgi:DNA-binding transcriptional regulator YiaG